ncbi:MAG: hypothetical protein NTY38_30265 [Acidobacteria bacterium]|nr:hypothetical protein [Acidobacteriota bacterium]
MESRNQVPSPRAEQMFGRGLGEVAWQLPVFGWISAVLSSFVFSRLWAWMHPESQSEYLRGDNLARDLVMLVLLSGIFWWAVCWLLGNVRRSVGLFLCIIALSLLDSRLYYSLHAVLDLLHDKSLADAIRPATELHWISLWYTLLNAAGEAATVAVALKLRQRLLFLLPLLALVIRGLIGGLQMLSLQQNLLSHYKVDLLLPIPGALLFGLALWAGFEFQRRRQVATERLDDRRINTSFYVLWPAVGLLLGLNLLAVASNADRSSWQQPVLFIAAGLAILASSVMDMVFLYRAWSAIRSPFTTSPGSAVGLLFVPIYNVYWIFQAFPGFATEYNSYADYHQSKVPHLSRGWMLAFVLCCFITQIPLVGLFLTWLPVITGAVAISRMGDAVNRLPASDASA